MRYFDNSYPATKALIYAPSQVNKFIQDVSAGKTGAYGKTDIFLNQALRRFSKHIAEKQVAVLGSVKPLYEAFVLVHGGHPTTIEYNKIISQDSRLIAMTVNEYKENPIKFDALISISSFEHDGLGRYGDPINPSGDLEAMEACKHMLKPGGLLFLAVPTGADCLVWNAHRIYGKIRYPMLLKGWKTLGFFGKSPSLKEDLNKATSLGHHVNQPVLVLTPHEST